MTELNVAGLSMDPVSKSPILVLRTTSGLFILPIWIGPSEAVSISLALQEVDVPRPLTHDLLLSAVEAVGYLLKSIQIIRCEEGVFYAQLELSKGSRTVLVDCRPSDAVAVALRAQAPILKDLHEKFDAQDVEVINIGDSVRARRIIDGVLEGHHQVLTALELGGYL